MTEQPSESKRIPVAVPVILSGFVCPGLGQFVQRRRLAGAIFLGLSAAAVAWFLAEVVPVVRTVYALAFEEMSNTAIEDTEYSLARIGMALALILVLWLANLFDVFYAVTRQRLADGPRPPDGETP